MVARGQGDEVRRFGCTSCGKCCDMGPEMELGEATALADRFVMSVVFKAHSIPLNERSARAADWWREQRSRIPLRAAFQEKRRHLAAFASRRRSDRQNDREIYLTISATVDDYGGGCCPALSDGRCAIYEDRPLTCRTVPLHYSRPSSTLAAYLDTFAATPGYACDTATGPLILDGGAILALEIRDFRERAVETAKADRRWKEHMLAIMDDPQAAARCGLPTYEAILSNTDNGYATTLPMIVAWRVAEYRGLISSDELSALCGVQLALIRTEISRLPSARDLRELIPVYEAGAAGRGRFGGLTGALTV